MDEHGYNLGNRRDKVVNLLSGLTARRMTALAQGCQDCLYLLTKTADQATEEDRLTLLRSKGGYLLGSPQLNELLLALEEGIMRCVAAEDIHSNLIFSIMDNITWEPEKKVGCLQHETDITKGVIKFYVIMRLHFIANNKNKDILSRKKAKSLKKKAHCQ